MPKLRCEEVLRKKQDPQQENGRNTRDEPPDTKHNQHSPGHCSAQYEPPDCVCKATRYGQEQTLSASVGIGLVILFI